MVWGRVGGGSMWGVGQGRRRVVWGCSMGQVGGVWCGAG